MKINIVVFGQIADITGTHNLTLDDVGDTSQLVDKLTYTYPALATTKFAIAVDKKIVREKTQIDNNSTVALLPPFSGG